jgi:predicted dehydrogenase
MSPISRRTMLRTGATALTAASYSRVMGANERIRLGVVGCGSRGTGDMRTFLATNQVDVAAVCDVWGARVDRAKRVAPQAAAFSDHRKLLELKDVDAILIGTPDHWHVPIAIDAVNAGKDVYCEKPLTLKIEEGPPIIRAVRTHNRVFQTGMQQRSGPHYIQARDEYIRKGKLGKISLVRTWWHGSVSSFVKPVPPELEKQPADLDWKRFVEPVAWRDYQPYQYNCFRAFLDYGGGQITDLFTHWIDVVHMFLGEDQPVAASANGGIYIYHHDGSGRTAPDTISVSLQYPGDFEVTFEATLAAGVDSNGIEFYGTGGRLFITRAGFEFTPVEAPAVQPALLPMEANRSAAPGIRRSYRPQPFPPPSATNKETVIVRAEGHLDGFHVQNFLDCVKSRDLPNADVAVGHRSAQACHLATLSYKERRRIRFDPAVEQVLL